MDEVEYFDPKKMSKEDADLFYGKSYVDEVVLKKQGPIAAFRVLLKPVVVRDPDRDGADHAKEGAAMREFGDRPEERLEGVLRQHDIDPGGVFLHNGFVLRFLRRRAGDGIVAGVHLV